MTEKANPSINRPAEAFKTAGAIAYGGHGGDGFVVDGANPTDIAVQDGGITEADLNAFAETSGDDSLDVTIDGGEAFVFGSWLAIDTDTTVSLAASTDGQTVYVGWNKNGADDVIVGLAADFSDASGDTDERIPLWTFDTDGSGVTTVTDERRIGYTQEATTFTGDVDLDNNDITDVNGIRPSNGIEIGVGADNGDSSNHIAIGNNANTLSSGGVDQVAIGSDAFVSEREGVAVGKSASVTGSTGAIALGRKASASGSNSVALGRDASATAQNSVAIGIGVTASNQDIVTLGQSVEIDEFELGTNQFRRGVSESPSDDQFEKPNIEVFTGSNSERASVAFANANGKSFVSGNNNSLKFSTGALSDGTGGSQQMLINDTEVEVYNPLRLDNRTTDPSAAVGSMWYRSDLD